MELLYERLNPDLIEVDMSQLDFEHAQFVEEFKNLSQEARLLCAFMLFIWLTFVTNLQIETSREMARLVQENKGLSRKDKRLEGQIILLNNMMFGNKSEPPRQRLSGRTAGSEAWTHPEGPGRGIHIEAGAGVGEEQSGTKVACIFSEEGYFQGQHFLG